jgi:hypothetical protein
MGHISFWFVLMMFICWEIANAINKNTENLTVASKEVGLDINIEKSNVCCYLVTRMKVKFRIKNVICKCGPVKIFGNDSKQIKILFRRKLKREGILVIFATILSRTFYLPI